MPRERTGIGALVRMLRRQADMTQGELAKAIGCSTAQLSLIESGQRKLTLDRAHRIERKLKITDGRIVSAVLWQTLPKDLKRLRNGQHTLPQPLISELKQAIRSADPVAALRKAVEASKPNVEPPHSLENFSRPARSIPLINKVAAGYPTEFTDLGYPASVADEYVACPEMSDPDAFAARVVGDSMEPEYVEGDIVVFSPQLPTEAGADCFVRLERDNETTFKRVYFEDEGQIVRLQPLNNTYPPRFVHREDISGMYAAAYVMRKVNRHI